MGAYETPTAMASLAGSYLYRHTAREAGRIEPHPRCSHNVRPTRYSRDFAFQSA
jgi:hypothetical protein